MIKAHLNIEALLLEQLEDSLYEIAPHNWVLYFNHSKNTSYLEGYFDSSLDAEESLKKLFSTLQMIEVPKLLITKLEEEDWVNSYKKHFHPWSIGCFHWVPIWCKNSYVLPEDNFRLYLDPGMAFGTGNHETTKLCLDEIVELNEKIPNNLKQNFLDIGCGSGILALTASILGFEGILAIDNDPLAIKVSQENAELNDIKKVNFKSDDLDTLTGNKKYNLVVANIQADILQKNAETLITLLNNDGILILSGILSKECPKLEKYFKLTLKMLGINSKTVVKKMNDWSLIRVHLINSN
ncbi:MAG: 50S ribosomal protein L11 methyltransferase [Opitutales bacterium]|nr:50S ribosomal protein L11 methyltransferase [Opitutales bacterium]